MAVRGDPKKWDSASEIKKCNPLMWHYPDSRKLLLQERDRARLGFKVSSPVQELQDELPIKG